MQLSVSPHCSFEVFWKCQYFVVFTVDENMESVEDFL